MVSATWLGTLWPLLALALLAGWRTRKKGIANAAWWWLLPLAYFVALLQLQFALSDRLPRQLEGQTLTFHAQVIGLPASRFQRRYGREVERQALTLDISNNPHWPGSHRINAVAYDELAGIAAGDLLTVALRMRSVRSAHNASGRDFERVLLANGVAARATVMQWQKVGEADGLHVIRAKLSAQVRNALSSSPTAAAVVPALVVGDRTHLGDALQQDFQRTGTAHLLVISGLHVALLAGAVWALCRWVVFPLLFCRARTSRLSFQQWAWWPSLVAALGYAMLAGLSLPTLRAVVMWAVLAICHTFLLRTSLWRSLLIAALVTLILMPLSALSESFWLSFGAVAAIATLSTQHAASRLTVLLPLVMTLIGATLLGQWTWFAPLVNVVMVPLFSVLALPLSLLGALLNNPSLFIAAGTVIEACSWLMRWLPESNPHSLLPLPTLSSLVFLLAAFFLWLMPALPLARRVAPLLLLPWLLQAPPSVREGEWRATVFDVGQGLAVAIETRNHVLLYDVGASWDGGSVAQSTLLPWLSQRGIRPDLVMISHGDNDHAGGVAALPNGWAVVSGEPARLPISADACADLASWQWDGVSFQVLWPLAEFERKGNDASCVLWVEGAYASALLPGDITRQSEYEGLRFWPEVDLLVLAHHGSHSSTTEAFLKKVSPAYAIASAGYKNRFGHPHPEVLARLYAANITLFRTDHDGMIEFRWGQADNGPQITKWRYHFARPWHHAAGWRFY